MTSSSFTDTAPDLSSGPAGAVERPRPFATLAQADLAGLSHQGLVRPNNEDRFLIVRAGRFLQTLATNLEDGLVPEEFGDAVFALAVADGMGGVAAGEVASRRAITVLVNLVLNTPDWIFGLGEPQVEEVLNRADRRFRDVNAALVEEARHDPALTGMGTTLTLAWSLGTDLFVAHVGDSRAYLFRRGVLQRLTRDHTMAQGLADIGVIPAQEVATHRLRHVLTNALGMKSGGHPEIHRAQLADGDRLLVCTDGLTEMVDEATIAAELGRHPSSAEACQALVDRALAAGGRDNVTVALAGYRIPPAA